MQKVTNVSLATVIRWIIVVSILMQYAVSHAQAPCDAYYTSQTNGQTKSVSFQSRNTSGLAVHHWSFGDGTFSTATNPLKTYSTNGTYFVCHLVTTPNACTDTFCTTIYISSVVPCVANFNSFTDSISGTTYFNNTSSGTNLVYTWSFGDGTYSSTQTPSHQYSQSGWYTVCLTVTNPFDSTCYSNKCSQIYVLRNSAGGSCTAAFSSSNDPLVSGKVNFVNQSTNRVGLDFMWTFGDGGVSYQQTNTSHQYQTSGTYTVCLFMSDSLNICSDTVCKQVTVVLNTPPPSCNANFTYQVNQQTSQVSFSSSSQGTGLTHQWYFHDNTTSTQANPVKTYSAPGTYFVMHFVFRSDSIGRVICSDSMYQTITISGQQPTCNANFSYQVNAQTRMVSFFSMSQNNVIHWWEFYDGSQSNLANPQKVYPAGGPFGVLHMVSKYDSAGGLICVDTAYKTIYVQGGGNRCDATFTFYRDSIDPNLISFSTLYPQANGTTYSWQFGPNPGTSSTQANPTHYFAIPGPRQICLTITNIADSCFDTYCDTIMIQAGNTGIKQEKISIGKLYPIPVSDELNVEVNSEVAEKTILMIYDMTGKLLLNKEYELNLGQNKVSLDTSLLNRGMYLLVVQNSQGKLVKQLMK